MNRRALRIWLDAASALFRDAQGSLEPEEFDALLDVFCTLIARHRLQEEPTMAAQRVVGPRLVIEIPIESPTSMRWMGTREEVSRLQDWIGSKYELVHLVDAARTLGRA